MSRKAKDMQVSTMKVPNPHGLIVPDVQRFKGETIYREDRTEQARSLRDDPLGRLHDRKQINQAQYQAGRRMQLLLELTEVGRLRSQDPSNEPVDGGGAYPDILSERQLRAMKRLNGWTAPDTGKRFRGVYDVLGAEGTAIMRLMLAERRFAREIAAAMGDRSQRGVDYIARRVRECLTTLAREFGYA